MVCPYCGHATKVTNSRPNRRSGQIWRRRQCSACQRVWSTYEAADYGSLIVVQSQNGDLTPLSRDKLLVSFCNSLQHRSEALQEAAALCNTVLPLILAAQLGGSLSRFKLAQIAAEVLDRFDQAAGVHYRAIHHL